ncbi:MAG: isoprenylcysteine carboxylmethyltransferase family protein [Chloroflexi bacterium]|nr:isoprenylcysteine carboxylmethyltransferase family protein [Chloroflexota bacterium]MDL1885632.1 isoprenylcysteine carboxylmethyltransferase family protein [Anaerolineae bacterium CFX8]
MDDTAISHFNQWGYVILWIVIFGLFLFFTPFYKKSQRKPASVYLAFIIALALEMFGVPLSMYALTWVFGKALPDGVLWGHTLNGLFGDLGLLLSYVCIGIGAVLIIWGWRDIYKHYWSKEEGRGELVTQGIYAHIRHPQYTGFWLITLGMLFDWATLPMLIMYPLLLALYYRLARREEADMEAEFGEAYRQYRARTGMFLPKLFGRGKGERKRARQS